MTLFLKNNYKLLTSFLQLDISFYTSHENLNDMQKSDLIMLAIPPRLQADLKSL
jgi:hypothetical protein